MTSSQQTLDYGLEPSEELVAVAAEAVYWVVLAGVIGDDQG